MFLVRINYKFTVTFSLGFPVQMLMANFDLSYIASKTRSG